MTEAVLLMAYGGPESLADLPAYLLDVRGGRPLSPDALAAARERYTAIGGASPLPVITRAQAAALQAALDAHTRSRFRVYVAMRHWYPYIKDVVARIAADGLERVTAVCMTPQYSRVSVGAYRQKLAEAQATLAAPLKIHLVEQWYDHPLFIGALAETVKQAWPSIALRGGELAQVVFTAHSVPAAVVEQGDPYDRQARATARLAAQAAGLRDDQWRICYQSAEGAHVRWLGPTLQDVTAELIAEGRRSLLVVPIGFVSDHLETLYELDIALKSELAQHGVVMDRPPALNASPEFIAALADIVLQAAQSVSTV